MPEVLNLLQLVEQIQQDFRNVVNETKRKYVPIKDNAEAQIKNLKELVNGKKNIRDYLTENNLTLTTPFIEGCSTKQPKLVTICLTALQRMITNKVLNEKSAEELIKVLSFLTENEIEELKVLQTTILLITASQVVTDVALSQALGICLNLHAGKTSAIVNTAAAAIRQCTSAVFDRILKETAESSPTKTFPQNSKMDTFSFTPSSKAAFFLFQDLCLLTSGDAPHWFNNIEWTSKLLGLELIESVLINYSNLFILEKEFNYLLKERVCPLVIKLLTPVLPLDVQRSGPSHNDITANNQATSSDFGVNVRLNRVILLLCSTYFDYLNTECEVFLLTLMRMVDGERIMWRRAIAMEVLFKVILQPELLMKICQKFDLLDPPSRVFQEMVNTMSNYVQVVLRNQNQISANKDLTTGVSGSTAGQGGANGRPAFIYRGSQFIIADVEKFALMEMLDRHDQPVLPEGYCLRMGISCLLQFVWSLQPLIKAMPQPGSKTDGVCIEKLLVEFAWCGLLPAFSILIEACSDDKLTESFLLAESVLVVLSSKCYLNDARDAFVAAVCKAALPSNFSLTVLSSTDKLGNSNGGSNNAGATRQGTTDEALDRSPVVIVVNATHGPGSLSLDTSASSGGIVNGPNINGQPPPSSLFITAKHIQASRALLDLAKTNGHLLDSSWHLVLTTFQQLVWMLGLKATPSQALILRPNTNNNNTSQTMAVTPSDVASMNLNTVVFESMGGPSVVNPTSVAMATSGSASPNSASSVNVATKLIAELPILSITLSAIFENSKTFDETALHYLVIALCKLASETCEIATKNRDPSHFSVAKLTEVGLANMHRTDIWWKNINDQLLVMSKVPHLELRKLSVDAVILLVKQAIITPRSSSFWENSNLMDMVLEPLSQLTGASYNDVQEKQLECVQYLLHCYGDEINSSWLKLINIIGAISQSQSERLIKTAFQCFQLVVTDYLSTLRPDCYPACVETAARFSHQGHDLNISLAAVGSLLHLTDFLFQRERGSNDDAVIIEQLWVNVFCHLSDLCRDRRPAVRKSAGQTLFNTIECHSGRFVQTTWFQLLWTVFFPLLSEVQDHCANAPMERAESKQSNLLVHHSRDTAAKQWAETVVLTLCGVARCFVSKREQLITLDRFPEAWDKLLSNAERAVLTPNSEIARNALTTLRILLDFDSSSSSAIPSSPNIWLSFWRTWLSIGHKFVNIVSSPPDGNTASSNDVTSTGQQSSLQVRKIIAYAPDGELFALYFDLFPAIFPRIQANFNCEFFSEFGEIVQQGVLGPLLISNGLPSSYSTITSSYLNFSPNSSSFTDVYANQQDDTGLTCTQRAVFACLTLFAQVIQTKSPSVQPLLVPFIELLLRLSSYAVHISRPGSAAGQVEAIPLSYIIFSEKCLALATTVYKQFADLEIILLGNVMHKMIETLRIPMAMKYKCQCQSTWLLASRCFIDVIIVGVPLATARKPSSINVSFQQKFNAFSTSSVSADVWDAIFATLRDFLFCQNQPKESLSGEEFQQHEALDCKFIDLICDRFLAHPEGLPAKFIEQMISLLGLGSVQASINIKDFATLSIESLNFSTGGPGGLLPPSVHSSSIFNIGGKSNTDIPVLSSLNNTHSFSEGLGMDNLRPFSSREIFMKLCFESLLYFAFPSSSSNKSSGNQGVVLCRTAVRNVLERCQFILQRFSRSAQLTGKCPLPRAKLSEVNFAFQAMALMLTNFTAPSSSSSLDSETWQTIIDLYPLVVDCVFVAESTRLLPGLHKLLHLYGGLLHPKA